jgi:hypothetical protein
MGWPIEAALHCGERGFPKSWSVSRFEWIVGKVESVHSGVADVVVRRFAHRQWPGREGKRKMARRILLGALALGLSAPLAGCYQPVAYGTAGYPAPVSVSYGYGYGYGYGNPGWYGGYSPGWSAGYYRPAGWYNGAYWRGGYWGGGGAWRAGYGGWRGGYGGWHGGGYGGYRGGYRGYRGGYGGYRGGHGGYGGAFRR